jgi:predicted RNase H-like HicB family nuclease
MTDDVEIHFEWDDMARAYRAHIPEFPGVEARGRTRYDAQMALVYAMANYLRRERDEMVFTLRHIADNSVPDDDAKLTIGTDDGTERPGTPRVRS